jgi:hypothetical protein
MIRRRSRTRWLVAALLALLAAGFVDATGLVLCLGPDGHRALEIEHPGVACPTLASHAAGAAAISTATAADALATCLDLPAIGGTDGAPLSVEPHDVPTPDLATGSATATAASCAATRMRAPGPVRAGPPPLARHLRSTVLLV